MFKIFQKKNQPGLNFSVLGADLHSHLIPGVDDGSPDVATSLQLIRGLQELGFDRLVTTPHIMTELYPNTRKSIMDGLRTLKKALKEEKMDIPISAAAEYQLDEGFEAHLNKKKLMALPNDHVLVEMPFLSAPPRLFEYLEKIREKGYQPIMAHPERYFFLKNNPAAYQRLIDMGCLLQVNILSLIGYYGKPSRESAVNLLEKKSVTFLGTDLHHKQQLKSLRRALRDPYVQKVLGSYSFRNSEF